MVVMARIASIVLSVFLGAVGLLAQGDDVLSRLDGFATGIKSMTCSFVQTKRMVLLYDDMVSHGRMAFQSPDRLSWVYQTPYEYRFVLNGDKVHVGNDKRSSTVNISENKLFGTIARVMMNTVTGRIDDLKADFGISVKGDAPSRVVCLTPKRREMKQMLRQVELMLDEKTGTVTLIRLSEKNDDVTEIVLKDIKLNVPIDETSFVIP